MLAFMHRLLVSLVRRPLKLEFKNSNLNAFELHRINSTKDNKHPEFGGKGVKVWRLEH
jgi:hypothetical protein